MGKCRTKSYADESCVRFRAHRLTVKRDCGVPRLHIHPSNHQALLIASSDIHISNIVLQILDHHSNPNHEESILTIVGGESALSERRSL